MKNPYIGFPSRQFWKHAVVNKSFSELAGFYEPKFSIPAGAKIGAAGSCFAQHVRKYFNQQGLDVYDVEPGPKILLEDALTDVLNLSDFGYGVYSARFGNIYTVRQLLQLAREALRGEERSEEEIVWEKGGRFYDALRPGVFKHGFESKEELLEQRKHHLLKVRQLFRNSDYFIFTFGLTEAWTNVKTGLVYPTAPGVVAGVYDPDAYSFVNLECADVYADFCKFRRIVKSVNPKIKFIITVSPVSLAATATDDHVIVATTYSKSVLRAAAGMLKREFDDVDYFPSYDLLTSPPVRYAFHQPDLREIHPQGVSIVMQYFAAAHPDFFAGTKKKKAPAIDDDVFCEEALLGGQS